MNYVNTFIDIDIGGGASIGRQRFDAASVPDELLRCKNFFRPWPSLRIQASGEVSLCPLPYAGEGFGNIHDRDFIDILNGMQDAFVCRLHADNGLAAYRRYLDPAVFGRHIDHICSLRAVLTLIAKACTGSTRTTPWPCARSTQTSHAGPASWIRAAVGPGPIYGFGVVSPRRPRRSPYSLARHSGQIP